MITLEQFERFAGKKKVKAAIRREWIGESGTYADFIEQLYEDIDESIYSLQATRELRQKDGEDRISLEILGALNRQGYSAVHDGKTGGHVDLSVKMGEHSWIGEAKKDGNFFEGFLQLTTRYVQASGNFAHNQAGLLFYLIDSSDALGKLDSWRTKLSSDGSQCIPCEKNTLAFYSDHKLEGSGTGLKVRTMAVALFHKPKDKSARKSAARKAAKGVEEKTSSPRKKAGEV